ncbi:DoxX family protein [Chitinophagaceae bacterium IBVUCB1]|nr:DoxX family protein [Chitinophagaceae bacterium IBVUCB1]
MAFLTKLGKYNNAALLILRLGVGFMMILHGYPKLSGGAEKWEKLGGAMASIGIKFVPVVWGFMAAITETVGGLFFLLGLFFRPTSFLLFFTMLVAAAMHLSSGDGIMDASHAIELGIVFLAMFIIGPGKFSVDKG